MDKVTPIALQSYYYSVFATEQGQVVLRDIKYLLTGTDMNEFESLDPSLPHNELAAQAATRNVWDALYGMVDRMPVKKLGFKEMLKETYKLWKYNK